MRSALACGAAGRIANDALADSPRADLSRNGLQPLNRICSPERCLRGCATVQEIGDWLEKLGMPEYRECFAENKIDLSVLPHLTDQDLKDIGVPLGQLAASPRSRFAIASSIAAERRASISRAYSASSS
jgi:hypothetical protein